MIAAEHGIIEPATEPRPILLPYQQRWVADRSPVKIAEKSRRIGLTWAEAADSALTAAAANGDDTLYVGYNQDMAREFIETVAMWARAFGHAANAIEEIVFEDVVEDERRDIQAFRVRFASGHKVLALSSRPSNLRGRQGRVILDEAAFHPDLAELLKAAFALLIWGGRVIIISTHDGAENPFNELVTDVRAGRKPYSLHRIDFDEALADGLYKRVCDKLERRWSPEAQAAWRQEIIGFYGDGADEELFCIPRASSGAYLPSILIEQRMRDNVPVLRLECDAAFAQRSDDERERTITEWCDEELAPLLGRLDPNLLSYFGEDFGRTGDLTVIWPLQLHRDLVRRTPFVVELRNVPFRQQEQVLTYIVDRLPRFVAGKMDARGNGQYLAERAGQRYGARIDQVMLSPEWYRSEMPPYKAAYEDGTLEIPRDADILADHRAIVMERGIAHVPDKARTKGTDGQQRHADSAIAGVLAYAASRSEAIEYDYTPAPRADRLREGPRQDDDDIGGRRLRGRGAY